MRELTLVWMYHNILDLYGDQGNIKVFEKRCRDRGIQLHVKTCSVGEELDWQAVDLLFIGGGADKEQGVMYDDLLGRKEQIQAAIADGVHVLLICGGYQLFGQYYEDSDGNRLEGLGIFDYYTVSDGVHRSIGNIVIEAELNGIKHRFVGFENHGGMTYQVSKPFGKVVCGFGNTPARDFEGYFDGQVLGTYMHGPLLPKNFAIADYFIARALERRNLASNLQELDDSLAIRAKNVMIERCLKK